MYEALRFCRVEIVGEVPQDHGQETSCISSSKSVPYPYTSAEDILAAAEQDETIQVNTDVGNQAIHNGMYAAMDRWTRLASTIINEYRAGQANSSAQYCWFCLTARMCGPSRP